MPRHTDIREWSNDRKSYWAGAKGGRPLPKSAPIPKRGDTLPRNYGTSYDKAFWEHGNAVEYAKLFDSHCQIKVRYVHDKYGVCRKQFVVVAR